MKVAFFVSTLFVAAAAWSAPKSNKVNTALNVFQEHGPVTLTDVDHIPMQRIEGGGTLRTWKMPEGTERCELAFKSNGRPLNAKVELWEGPVRTIHTGYIRNQDGALSPYKCTLKFKPGPWTVQITNDGPYEFQIEAGVAVADPTKNEEIGKKTDVIFAKTQRVLLQGGNDQGVGGQVHSFPIDVSVQSVNVVASSQDVGKRAMKIQIEAIKGPNEPKQKYEIECAGVAQPYMCTIPTPGSGWTLRIRSITYLEYPCEIAVVPAVVDESQNPSDVVVTQW
mmetsp:Transcript_7417/g.9565  ORF Transcript_7417/g.9565 Transcript_7417/m.9565 type:complete len:280 (+) Transcript_7417:1431-2270(+)|eukprot:CAMPEP_0116070224 /NCGR_PEP_ID=MMETSP0322-20121206/12873_1 /TAXON_ID=163516 /ORGANISM="Leptocylindrus danicus var. apora, Strain B651" /LENGTH=279 /DNA_ID=CAMNT_0003557973 /DNA_START=1386 /DNA_END=2225 /DNA_ORIENTATION=+